MKLSATLVTTAMLSWFASSARAETGGVDAFRAHAAVQAAVSACKAQGYNVTATVVNREGMLVAMLRDGAGPQSLDSSRQKAFTVVSFGPSLNMDKSSQIAERLLAAPMSAQIANLPNVLLVGGAHALRANGAVVGAIGVGGAPGGLLDEACAEAGAIKFAEQAR